MDISVEISHYPLKDDYIPHIEAFIADLNTLENVTVITNTLSTQVFGDMDVIMPKLHQAMAEAFKAHGHAIFVCKFLHGDLSPKGARA